MFPFPLQILVKNIVENPGRYTWAGFDGSVCVYFAPNARLTIYHASQPEERLPEMPHTHVDDFRSVVVFGVMRERRYWVPRADDGAVYSFYDLTNEGSAIGEMGSCRLASGPALAYRPGESYEISASAIHSAFPDQGTVTFIQFLGKTRAGYYRAFFAPGSDLAEQVRRAPVSKQLVEEACGFLSKRLSGPGTA